MLTLETLEFDGCRFAYRMDGAGPPLVMLQGVGAYGTAPNPQVEILKNHYTCLTFDNRGIGASQPIGRRLSVEQMAADVLALMDHIGWDSAHIVGHSLGGLIAMQIALMARPRVHSLSLLCTFANGADATRMTPALLWILFRLRFGPRSIRRNAFLELVLPPSQMTGSRDGLAERLSRVFGHDIADLPTVSAQQVAAMRAFDATPYLKELSGIPTLVVSGEKDPIARPASGRAIAAAILGSRYVEIAGVSHAFPILEAERCGTLLLEHLANVEHMAFRATRDRASNDA